jgi:hypothetical protein
VATKYLDLRQQGPVVVVPSLCQRILECDPKRKAGLDVCDLTGSVPADLPGDLSSSIEAIRGPGHGMTHDPFGDFGDAFEHDLDW